MRTINLIAISLTLGLSFAASQATATYARTPASYGGVVYVDTNGNGTQDGEERPAPNLTFTLVKDQIPDDIHTFTTGDDGSFHVAGLIPENAFAWTLCPPSGWWVTDGGTAYFLPDHDKGCGRVYLTSGDNVTTIGVQDMAAQSAAPASLDATGFSDHNRDGVQDSGDTPYQLKTRLFLTGPTPNGTRRSLADSHGVMRWGPVFAPADGYAWSLCLDYPPPDDQTRYEITSITPGGTAAGDGCWDVTIAPGENHWSIGFYDRLQPGGTPTPTMTPPPEPTEVPLGMRLALDCDPSQDGVQASCGLTLGETSSLDVDVLLINDSGGDQLMGAVGATISTDRTRLYPPPFPDVGVNGNPDPDPAVVAAGFRCDSSNESQIYHDGESLLSCYSGTATMSIPEGSTSRIGTIHYVVPAGASPGVVPLEFADGDFADSTFNDRLCPLDHTYHHVLSACSGASVSLVSPATATPTPSATATTQAAQATATPTTQLGVSLILRVPADPSSSHPVSQTLGDTAGVAPVAATPGVASANGVLGTSVRPPNTGDGTPGRGAGGTWLGLGLLLAAGGIAASVAAVRRVRRM